ncbi:MAG TPA: zinc-binding dehydrogenase [bacterium]|nr:zinc-binding dehydrogenase [bacterium]
MAETPAPLPARTMGALVIRRHGGPDVLEWDEALPRPEAGPRQVLVRVEACGLNHLDLYTRREGHPARPLEFPHALGNEPVGVVETAGPDAPGELVGRRVVVAPGYLSEFHADRSGWDARHADYRVLGHQGPGGYAEYLVALAENVIPVSDRWSAEEWAATPLVFLTAWHMLVGRARVRPGETVLVMAAGSGVGSSAVQIARHLGCRVVATAGTPEKLERARELGAHETVQHYQADWPRRVRELTGGVDVVVEHVGEEVFSKAVSTLAYGGRLVTCGATTGIRAGILLNHLFAKQLSLLGSYMGDFAELREVLALLEAGHLRPVVDRVFPVRDGAEAHRRLEAGEHFGKIVLRHGGDPPARSR